MKHLNFLSKSSSRSCGHRVTTLALTVGSPSAHRRGAMLRLLSVLVLVLTIGVGNVWATDSQLYFEGWESHNNGGGTNNYGAGAKTYGDFSFVYADAAGSGSPLTDSYHAILRNAKNTNQTCSLTSSELLDDSYEIHKVKWNCKGNANQTLTVKYSTNGTDWTQGYSAALTTSKEAKSFTLNVTGPIYLKFETTGNNSTKSHWDANIDDIEIEGEEISVTPSYTITAQSNNNTYGTVSLSGSVITATPEANHRIASDAYTVTSGTATVERGTEANINKFTVTPSTNCTVQINFEPIPTHKISFSTGGLVDIADATGIQEGAVYNITQTPAASLTSNCEYSTFVGWTTVSSIANSSVSPSIISSYTMSTSDVTLHAVYSKTTGGGGSLTANFDGDWNSVFSKNYNGSFNPTVNSLSLSGTVDGVTVSATNGTSTNGYIKSGDSDDWRLYDGYTLTISSSNNITGITFTDGGKTFSNISTSTGTLSGKTWTGNATSISFSITGTCGIGTIAVTYSSAGTTTYSLEPNCCTSLGSINGSFFWTTHFCPAWPAKHRS